MRVLLDECLPVELAQHLPGHEVRAARQMGWLGVKNGRLLKFITESSEFDAFVTVDRNLPHQQNLRGLPYAVVILRGHTTRVPDVLAQAPALLVTLARAKPGEVLETEPPT